MDISGKTALITGGASGLGAACVRMIAEVGGQPVIIDLQEPAKPGAARFLSVDVTRAEAVEEAVRTLGPLHIAINCAGIAPAQRVLGKEGVASLDLFEKVIRVNLVGTFNIVRCAAAAMSDNEPNAQGERGVIINTASVAAYDGQIGQAAYAASKAGVAGMTLPLARDLARHGVRVMTIAPGIFDTPMMQGFSEEVRASLGASVPFPPRLGQPAEYAMLARHIIENPMLNGEVIRLDGALRMGPK